MASDCIYWRCPLLWDFNQCGSQPQKSLSTLTYAPSQMIRGDKVKDRYAWGSTSWSCIVIWSFKTLSVLRDRWLHNICGMKANITQCMAIKMPSQLYNVMTFQSDHRKDISGIWKSIVYTVNDYPPMSGEPNESNLA